MALNNTQVQQLTEAELQEYEALDTEGKEQFEYFFGFTTHTHKPVVVQNDEVIQYQKAAASIQLKTIATMLNFTPHKGQQPLFYTFDAKQDIYNNFVLLFGRRTGKSEVTSVVATRELFLPHSSTVLLTPVFENAKVIFNNVLKKIEQLGLPIKTINRGSFRIELENGARFSANSASNVEAALGSSNSLLIVDETQSIPDIKRIMNQLLVPTMLDYGVRDSGILWAHQVLLGTPRGEENELTDYYYNELTMSNWKSFRAASTDNPMLPTSYIKQMRIELGDLLYRQEILAEIIGSDENVFHSFDRVANIYYNEEVPSANDMPEGHTARNYFIPNKDSIYINGIDIGWSDATANIAVYRTAEGRYYVQAAYSKNNTTTAQHIKNYREMESKLAGENDIRFCDPSAAQTISDYVNDYDYDVVGAKNDIAASIKYINNLLAKTGVNQEPRLYIHESLGELIRQVSRIRYKKTLSKKSNDPFIKDPDGTHWDLIAALRYALFSDQYNTASINIIR